MWAYYNSGFKKKELPSHGQGLSECACPVKGKKKLTFHLGVFDCLVHAENEASSLSCGIYGVNLQEQERTESASKEHHTRPRKRAEGDRIDDALALEVGRYLHHSRLPHEVRKGVCNSTGVDVHAVVGSFACLTGRGRPSSSREGAASYREQEGIEGKRLTRCMLLTELVQHISCVESGIVAQLPRNYLQEIWIK